MALFLLTLGGMAIVMAIMAVGVCAVPVGPGRHKPGWRLAGLRDLPASQDGALGEPVVGG